MALPHHDGSPLSVSNVNPALGEEVTLHLRVPADYGPVSEVVVRSIADGEARWDLARLVSIDLDGWNWWQAKIEATNYLVRYRWALGFEDGSAQWLNQKGLQKVIPPDANDFALVAHPAGPDWLYSSVIYQIFPDRFARSAGANGRVLPGWAIPANWSDPVDPEMPGRSKQLYGGDLEGIIDHLDHIAQLGADVIYLTPFFPSNSNHRYDASTFEMVDPLLGGYEALIRLVKAAHARGMRVMGDITTNHSGATHQWFQAASSTEDAPERDFYYWDEDGNYQSWWGVKTLPKLNWGSESLVKRFLTDPDSVVQRWLRPPYSLDGWRVDVGNMTGRSSADDLNPKVRQTMVKSMREARADSALIAEAIQDATLDLQGDGWHGVMNWQFVPRAVWAWLGGPVQGEKRFWKNIGGAYNASDFAEHVNAFAAGIPWRMRLANMNALDSHDTGRFASVALVGSVPVALGLMVTLPGIPTIFQGDEFGELGEDGETSRTPMPWGSEDKPEVARTLSVYRELIALRKDHPVLASGGLRWLATTDSVVVYARESEEETILVYASKGSGEVTLNDPGFAGQGKLLHGNVQAKVQGKKLTLSSSESAFSAWSYPGVRKPPLEFKESE